MGKFLLKKTQTGYVFHLKAVNGETIATSEVYQSKSSAKQGIESVMRNAPVAHLEDQTQPDFKTLRNPKFEIYLDKTGEPRFRLKARNGQIVASSKAYKSMKSCENGVASVRENAPGAAIEEVE